MRQYSKYFLMVVCLTILGITISCEKATTEPEDIVEEPNQEIVLTVFPDIGTNLTKFQPDIYVVLDSDTVYVGQDYLIRCDYNDDGLPDTDWLDTIPKTSVFSNFGKHTLNIEVMDSTGFIDSASCNIYVQKLIQITPTNTSRHNEGNIDWSRDGTNRIAFDMYGGELCANQSIWVVQYPDGSPIKVSSNPNPGNYFYDQFPEWSSDGHKIACASSNGLDVIDLQTNQRTTLDETGSYYGRSWSPDGRWLIYWGHHENESKTMAYDFSNETTEVLFVGLYIIGWSPDGSKLATCRMGDWENSKLQVIDFESKDVIEEYIIPNHGHKLEWSPDGKWISLGFHGLKKYAYLYNYETKTTYTWQPDKLIGCWYPSWSEDGSLLAFEGTESFDGVWLSIWAIEFPTNL